MQILELDGTISYSNIEAVQFDRKELTDNIVIVPNPTSSVVTFLFSKEQEVKNTIFEIFDIQGRLAKTGQLEHNASQVELSLVPGVYTVRFIRDGVRLKEVKRLVVL